LQTGKTIFSSYDFNFIMETLITFI